jgi:hypothetical protein
VNGVEGNGNVLLTHSKKPADTDDECRGFAFTIDAVRSGRSAEKESGTPHGTQSDNATTADAASTPFRRVPCDLVGRHHGLACLVKWQSLTINKQPSLRTKDRMTPMFNSQDYRTGGRIPQSCKQDAESKRNPGI